LPRAATLPYRKPRFLEQPKHGNVLSSSVDPSAIDIPSKEERPEQVTILAKEPLFQPDIFKARRLIAQAETADIGLRFHGQIIPDAHVLLVFRGINKREKILPIPRGGLDYKDPIEGTINVGYLDNGQLFY
jgi:hypothetical protein